MKNKLLNFPVLKKGSFYFIKESDTALILEDKTKRGLQIREHCMDEKLNVEADMGIIYDMDGIGHKVPIRWFFPKADFALNQVSIHAEIMEKKYTQLRELTCPDDA